MKLRDYLEEIKTEMITIRKDLNYHIHRTDLLEEKQAEDVKRLSAKQSEDDRHLRYQIKPLVKVYHFFQILGALIVVAAAVAGIIRLFI